MKPNQTKKHEKSLNLARRSVGRFPRVVTFKGISKREFGRGGVRCGRNYTEVIQVESQRKAWRQEKRNCKQSGLDFKSPIFSPPPSITTGGFTASRMGLETVLFRF